MWVVSSLPEPAPMKFDVASEVLVDDKEAGSLSEVEAPGSLSYKELVSSQPSRPTWYERPGMVNFANV